MIHAHRITDVELRASRGDSQRQRQFVLCAMPAIAPEAEDALRMEISVALVALCETSPDGQTPSAVQGLFLR
jgi:hypothetical protein